MIRKLKISIVVLIVIGFPLISWIYLRSGLNWRIKAQEETAVKGLINAFSLSGDDGVLISNETLLGRFYIITDAADSVAAGKLNAVHEQFAVRDDFRTICILDDLGNSWHPSGSGWINATCETGCAELMKLLFMDQKNAAIVDDSLRVRGRYDLTNMDEVRALIRHTAVVLPIEKREKLELKRGEH